MDGDSIVIGILVLCIIACIYGIISGVMGMNESKAPVVENTSCEHEFVVSSEYDLWMKSYRTFSVCHKCGKEI